MQPETRGDGADQGCRLPSRRSLLRIGSLGALGLTLPGLLRAEGELARLERWRGGHRAEGKNSVLHPDFLLRGSQPS